MNEKISIIIPVYNIEKYLPKTLESVLAQTHKNLEIILVNDGSADKSADIMESYKIKDDRIITIHKDNGGVSDARNVGISSATGNYIVFVDGDDFIEPDMFERLLNNLKKYDADISHCGYKMVLPSKNLYFYNTGELRIQNDYEGLISVLEGRKIEPGMWNKLYKTKIVKDIIIDSKFRSYEDFLFNVFAFEKAKIAVYEDVPLYSYMVRPGSGASSKTSIRRVENFLDIADILLEHFKENRVIFPFAKTKALSLYIAQINDVCKSKSKEFKVLIPRIKSFIRNNCDSTNMSKKTAIFAKAAKYSFTLYRVLCFMKNMINKILGKKTYMDDLKKMRKKKD